MRTRVTTRASTPSRTPRSQLPLPVTRYASTFPRKNQRLSSFQVPHSMTKSSFFVQRFSKLNQRAYVCQDRLGTMTTGGVLCNGCEEVEKGRLLRCCAGTKLVPMGPYGKAVAWDPDPSKRTHVRANTRALSFPCPLCLPTFRRFVPSLSWQDLAFTSYHQTETGRLNTPVCFPARAGRRQGDRQLRNPARWWVVQSHAAAAGKPSINTLFLTPRSIVD